MKVRADTQSDVTPNGETVDWMHAGPERTRYSPGFAGISEADTKRTRDAFFPKAALDPSAITGLSQMTADGIPFKFLQAPLTQDQLAQIIQIERKAP